MIFLICSSKVIPVLVAGGGNLETSGALSAA